MEINDAVALGVSFILGVALITDLKRRIIPNALTLPAIVTGWIFHTAHGGIQAGATSMAASVMALGLVGILYIFHVVGAGDVKLFIALGSWAGFYWMLMTLIGSVLLCGILGFIVVIGRVIFKPWRYVKHLPMMYAVFPAAWITTVAAG